MNSNLLDTGGVFAFVLAFGFSVGVAYAARPQESTFDWLPSSDESPRLDPADYHTGRGFRPGDQAGNVHVDIDAQEPLTVERAPAEEWSEAVRHPELLPRVKFRCVREHVTKTTYICDVAPGHPMTLVLRDERDNAHTAVTAFGATFNDHGTVREFVSPNDIHIQYYRWACVQNCNPPRYQWMSELKKTYDLTSAPKIYGGITPERDGEPFSVKMNSPVLMTVAVVPSRMAGELREKPDSLDSTLDKRPCMEKSVSSADFECTFDLADGPRLSSPCPK